MARHYELIQVQNLERPSSSNNVDEVILFKQKEKRGNCARATKAYMHKN